jgi:catechol 2,3-dioxygenase-like lactoylglutathione lyase family enzyme
MASLALVGLRARTGLLPDIAAFYGELLGMQPVRVDDAVGVEAGESRVEWRPADGEPFYHVALLVPGDRFAAAHAWAGERVELLPGPGGETVVDFSFWDALACYFHDPAGTIVELIAHRGIARTGASGAFAGAEVVGVSEVGIVCDPPVAAAALERELGLRVWDGTVDGERSLAFVGEQARTLILCRAGRPWLPTGRPAEPWPVDVTIAGEPHGEVRLGAGVVVRAS